MILDLLDGKTQFFEKNRIDAQGLLDILLLSPFEELVGEDSRVRKARELMRDMNLEDGIGATTDPQPNPSVDLATVSDRMVTALTALSLILSSMTERPQEDPYKQSIVDYFAYKMANLSAELFTAPIGLISEEPLKWDKALANELIAQRLEVIQNVLLSSAQALGTDQDLARQIDRQFLLTVDLGAEQEAFNAESLRERRIFIPPDEQILIESFIAFLVTPIVALATPGIFSEVPMWLTAPIACLVTGATIFYAISNCIEYRNGSKKIDRLGERQEHITGAIREGLKSCQSAIRAN